VAEHREQFSVQAKRRSRHIQASGFCAWLKTPLRKSAQEGARQTELLKEACVESVKVYEHRKLHDDLPEQGQDLCLNRLARLTKLAGIKAQIVYKRHPWKYGGAPSILVDNILDRQFDVMVPDKVWVTYITYIWTQERFAFLAVVIDLFSRCVVGRTMQSRQTTDVVLQDQLLATWRREPKAKVLIHSDQASQFASMDWAVFLKAHNLENSIRRRGNCHDNAVA